MKEGQTQEPVGGMDENIISKIIQAQIGTPNQSNVIENHMADYFKRFASYKDKFTELEWYHIFLDFYDAVQDATPPPAEGEDEINLLKETINNQHALILSAEQRGYEKAKEEFSAPPSPDVEALAEKYANGIIPNPNSKDAPYYTTGNVWDEISDAFKAGYSASLPQSSKTFYCWHKEATGEDICKQQCKDCSGCKGSEEISNITPQSSTEEEKDDDEGWIYCPNCGRVKEEQ